MPTITSLAIFKELTTPISISGLAEKLALNNSTISTAVSSLIIEGLAIKQRNGKKVIVKRSDTLHAHSLENFLKEYPRLPVKKLFSYSSMEILSALTHPHNITDIAAMTGLNRHTSSTALLNLSKYGIVLKKNGKYSLNQRHRHVVNFIGNYWSYIANQRLRDITEDAIILWQRGPEFMFKVQGDLDHNNEPDRIHPTATTVFSGFDLGLMATTRYYFYSKRQLTVEDYILHTILVDQQNSIYNSYALALTIRSGVKNLMNIARHYDIEDHIRSLLDYLRTKEKNSDFVLPWDEYLDLVESMKVN
jgi:predicted transcriptional regulator